MSSPTSGDDAFELRYRKAIELARAEIARLGVSELRLARILEVDRTSLNRFLNREKGFSPSRTRPAMLRILERIEETCQGSGVAGRLDVAPPAKGFDDDEAWFRQFVATVRELSEHWSGPETLTRVGVLCSQAAHGPRDHRDEMIASLLRLLATRVAEDDAALASPALLRETSRRAARLEQVLARGASEEAVGPASVLAGATHVYVGGRLDEGAMVERGLERLLGAATASHASLEGRWAVLFGAVEWLLERAAPCAERWASRTAFAASRAWDENVEHTCRTRSFPRLYAYWRERHPELRVSSREPPPD